jgi:type I restriction enzyme S subunit
MKNEMIKEPVKGSGKYKQTDIGIIPEDWEEIEMGKIGISVIGLTYSPLNISESGILVHRSSNIQNNNLSYDDNVFVNIDVNEKLILRENDILICVRNGSRNLIGKSALIKGRAIGETFGAFMSVFRTDYYAPFIYQLFISNVIQKQINETLGATINQITNKNINEFIIPIPNSKAEQTAIATALSDADDLISNLEKLIEKKRNIKQGAMQQLLNPNQNGRQEKWEEKTIREVATFRRGSFPQPYGLDKWYDEINGAPFVQVFDVDDNLRLKDDTKWKISKLAQPMSVLAKKGSVILTIQGSIGRIAITQYDAFIDRTLLIFENFLIPFDTYFFTRIIEQVFEIEKQNAPGGIIKTITKEALSSFKITFPKIEEQIRISNILKDIDNEITSLEEKLSKSKMIKQGMMQELLTGKIRLV